MTNRKSPEPLVWLLFSVGGMAAALLVPVVLFLFGLAFPLGWLSAPDHAYLLSVLRNPVTRLVLFALCVLALFHWAHRFRYTLYDGLRLRRFSVLISLACYGGAVIGSGAAAYFLLRV
ncbi:fumarate reductase subunit D [Nocardia sp. GAS34]|uniref:fumarate reductase subunit FrdD n=1 Tax=unclassified Nocardia TaxID=2637762 RepID=UPI003D21B84D